MHLHRTIGSCVDSSAPRCIVCGTSSLFLVVHPLSLSPTDTNHAVHSFSDIFHMLMSVCACALPCGGRYSVSPSDPNRRANHSHASRLAQPKTAHFVNRDNAKKLNDQFTKYGVAKTSLCHDVDVSDRLAQLSIPKKTISSEERDARLNQRTASGM
eukprot:m.380420 g.380420  ORF g.380420 m.380420 type:complete len:156 (-) comp28237_c3_seq3:2949-3416(-)